MKKTLYIIFALAALTTPLLNAPDDDVTMQWIEARKYISQLINNGNYLRCTVCPKYFLPGGFMFIFDSDKPFTGSECLCCAYHKVWDAQIKTIHLYDEKYPLHEDCYNQYCQFIKGCLEDQDEPKVCSDECKEKLLSKQDL